LLCIDPISVAFGLRNHQKPKCFSAFIHDFHNLGCITPPSQVAKSVVSETNAAF